MSEKTTIKAGEWIIKADSVKSSKFWDVLEKLNKGGSEE